MRELHAPIGKAAFILLFASAGPAPALILDA